MLLIFLSKSTYEEGYWVNIFGATCHVLSNLIDFIFNQKIYTYPYKQRSDIVLTYLSLFDMFFQDSVFYLIMFYCSCIYGLFFFYQKNYTYEDK
ncbi:hypothetical protein Hanom_Chr12g01175191 [Helianthus anomalus]